MIRRALGISLAMGACAAVLVAAGCYPDYAGPIAGTRHGADTDQEAGEPQPVTADGGASGTGLPCLVQALLEEHCQSCHSQRPSAPMPLMTYADLVAKAPSDPKKRVVDVAVARVSSASAPMPPSGLLAASEASSLIDWAKAGAPRGTCEAAPLWDSGASNGPECRVTADCPRGLTCVSGACTGGPPPSPPPEAGTTLTFADPRSGSAWTTANLASLSLASAYNGAVFDGRYVYFAPDGSTAMALRYDTQKAYSDAASWSTYALARKSATAFGYRGATFDGRYVYFVPATAKAVLVRFDTRGSFSDDAMWTAFDLNGVGASGGFQGGTFDGRYLMLTPTASVALRYDTQGDLTAAQSWSAKDLLTVAPSAYGFVGGVFDGRYVYYAPNSHAGSPHGTVARYDTSGSFTMTASWSTFDLTTVSPHAVGFRTAAFDGRYVYLVPGWSAPTPAWSQGVLARLDTHASFTQASSWSTFDTGAVDSHATGYNSATFDGRYLVFGPGYDAASATYHGRVLALDTESPMDAASSWVMEDTAAFSQKNLRGAAFDGRYIYFPPSSGVAMRLLRHEAFVPAPFPIVGGSFY